MKNDIKTKSTDFLPPKPGDDATNAPATPTAEPAAAPKVDAPATANPAMPTSAHVIDLKSQAPTENTADKGSNDFMVKNNPFLQGPNNKDGAKTEAAKPATIEVSNEAIKTEKEMPAPPKAEAEPEASKDEAVKVDTTKPPAVDIAHPEPDSPTEKDPLKDAMVSDTSKPTKPKRKMPTWLIVLIILIAIIVIAVGTFAVLNIVARPTGV